MATFTEHVDIEATTDAVWDVVASVRRLPDYSTSTVEVIDAPERLESKGDTFVQVVRILGKRWKSKWTVVELTAGSLLRTRGVVGHAVTISLSQHLERRADNARLRLEITYDVPGGSLGQFVTKNGLEKRARAEARSILDGIKQAAEAGTLSPTG